MTVLARARTTTHVLAAALVLGLAGAPAAHADRPVVPGAGEVRAARDAAATADRQATRLASEQATVAHRLTALQLGVARAVDAQRAAEQELARAKALATKAADELDNARAEQVAAHRDVADAAVRAWTSSGEVNALELALTGSPESMADAQVVLDLQGRRTSAALSRAAGAAAAGAAESAHLEAARADQATATRQAQEARQAAERAEADAAREAAALAARAEALDARVAALRARAARLATQRASGLRALARARARAEAEARRRAEREARAARDHAAQGGASTPVVGGGGGSPASAQRTARSLLGAHGWGGDQFGCLVDLWNGESGWSWSATNPSSGAYGIPQALPSWKMASAGSDWLTNPTTQVRWGMEYIQRAYGSPCAAWGAWQARSPHWY
ncbi:hypothetical protein KMZ32_12975 [Phycicoccus sp. MAQZ13P-2]|uniref:aggregation-promoting factor C-terminal-like domain-containing protein n=1 Tax=Phycicoccus mangrovi TaxID=2840470 RepID=UPI001C004789|nr:hypothetical protein [Phycicoccus mangrovi]MBT9256865.1 hypothetical protein [Phycicoccus mangrovi]MBT9274986.1 hypothetical protein [Phycicoccus mangrovi]